MFVIFDANVLRLFPFRPGPGPFSVVGGTIAQYRVGAANRIELMLSAGTATEVTYNPPPFEIEIVAGGVLQGFTIPVPFP